MLSQVEQCPRQRGIKLSANQDSDEQRGVLSQVEQRPGQRGIKLSANRDSAEQRGVVSRKNVYITYAMHGANLIYCIL